MKNYFIRGMEVNVCSMSQSQFFISGPGWTKFLTLDPAKAKFLTPTPAKQKNLTPVPAKVKFQSRSIYT